MDLESIFVFHYQDLMICKPFEVNRIRDKLSMMTFLVECDIAETKDNVAKRQLLVHREELLQKYSMVGKFGNWWYYQSKYHADTYRKLLLEKEKNLKDNKATCNGKIMPGNKNNLENN